MKKLIVSIICAFISLSAIAQADLGRMEKYGNHFPYNLQPSELNINGKISQVTYENYRAQYRFGELEIGNRVIGSALYKYNEKGQLIQFQKNGEGWFWYFGNNEWNLQYNTNGNIESPNHIYENGKLSKVIWGGSVYRIFYSNGTLSKVTKYNSDGEESYTSYFQNGDMTKEVTTPSRFGGYSGETRLYTYTNHKIINGDGCKYSYNNKGLVSKIICRGTPYEYQYEYDTKGNWVKRIRIEKDKNGYTSGIVLTIRKIEYQ